MSTGTAIMRQLFGTDGIRGVAGEYPLDKRTVLAIGCALGQRLAAREHSPRVVLGQDTRESGAWISSALAAGLESAGVGVVSTGVITTPGIAYLTRRNRFSAGIVISASHNPWQDNGIKIFGADGYKLSDQLEHEIESDIFAHLEQLAEAASHNVVSDSEMLPGDARLREQYACWLAGLVADGDFGRFRVLSDCANGAAGSVAPLVFRHCGIQAEYLNVEPNGRNINAGCGALYPEYVAHAVAAGLAKYDLGITFDGDADRALFSDASARVVNGDAVLLLAARDMKVRGTLANDTVVATTMSNMGLEAALGGDGITMLRAPVGDKYVLEQMLKTGATLGGEQSGHILFRDTDATTGDGILTALRVLSVMARSGQSLAELVADLKVYPQEIKNIQVREKKPFEQIPSVMQAIRAAEQDLKDKGRVVVRYSGTEKLARVMIEAESEQAMRRHTDAIATAVQQAIGV